MAHAYGIGSPVAGNGTHIVAIDYTIQVAIALHGAQMMLLLRRFNHLVGLEVDGNVECWLDGFWLLLALPDLLLLDDLLFFLRR